MKQKTTKAEIITRAHNEFQALQAQMYSSYFFANSDLNTLTKQNFLASAVIVSITSLSGKVIMRPVAVRDGLSPGTIQALQADITRAQKSLEFFAIKEVPK